MTSRKRNNSSTFNVSALRGTVSDRSPEHKAKTRRQTHKKRRQNILETLEARQLLAGDVGGPQLMGIQPNVGELIVDNSIVQTRPRVLTLRFDEDQQIDPSTLNAVQVVRAGEDDLLGTEDDVTIVPGLVSLGEDADNEVVVRFSEALVDDLYKVEVSAFDDPSEGVIGLRNMRGELLQTSDPQQQTDVTRFDLRLGALIEAVVPQPMVRSADGRLSQNRNEIVVYFNDDPLFVEDDELGQPTIRSAEHPRFYQLLLTQETVSTTDDALYHPDEVVYDEATNTARLIFSTDLNELPGVDGKAGVDLAGGTFRLRIGTAVDERVDLIVPLETRDVVPFVVTDFGIPGVTATFESVAGGESNSGRIVRFEDTGGAGLSVTTEPAASGLDTIVVNFGGDPPPNIGALKASVELLGLVNLVENRGDDPADPLDPALAAALLPASVLEAPALTLVAVGETLETSLDVGVFGKSGTNGALTSLILSESIDAQAFLIEPIGGDNDPGHNPTRSHINSAFGPDLTAGVREVAYNFQGVFEEVGAVSHLNQITPVEKERIREALNLWASKIGVQFRETVDQGITFAFGDSAVLQDVGPIVSVNEADLDASLRIDPTFVDSAMVFDRSATLGTDYGEDLTRKAVAGIGLLLGLQESNELSPQTIMSFNTGFLNADINDLTDDEPVFPGNTDVLHGQYLHRPDSVDIDLYKFTVDLDDPTQTGTLTAETFAERLADSSLLDTSLTLFEEKVASVTTDFGLGSDLAVVITSLLNGRQGNGSQISFVQTDRVSGDTGVRVLRLKDALGVDVPNGILLDLPRYEDGVAESLEASDLVDAINSDPFARSIFRASIPVGEPTTNLIKVDLGTFAPLRLEGGGLNRIQVNDDYFGEDSRIKASLGEGVYYLGVAASGNDQYDPTIAGSGSGGRTQGAYDLHLKFEPQVDETDVLRDLDGTRVDVPGTPVDADGDGVPGGVHNFWFQTRALDRMIVFQGDGETVQEHQTLEIMSADGTLRTYEFLQTGSVLTAPEHIPVIYVEEGPAQSVALALLGAINGQTANTGVSATSSTANYEGFNRDIVTLSGDRSVALSPDFRGVEVLGRTLFVDRVAVAESDGSLAKPFNNIANPDVSNAIGSAYFGDIIRIVGNGGLDGDLLTEEDNFSYQIGISEVGGTPLRDGVAMNIPRGVTTMVDAGAIFKLRNSYINVGSSTTQIDRSESALQVLGTPRHVQLSLSTDPVVGTTLLGDDSGSDTEGYADGSVIFTSMRDRAVDTATSGFSPDPAPGNWGGIIFRRDVDRFEGRSDLERDGIFLQNVNHAEIRYGGGSNVLIDSVQQLVNPIQIIDMRPTVSFNEITLTADSAISAAPNSFEETSYQAPQFQRGGNFTADYDRVGPDMYHNLLLDNSVNGVFIRVATTPVEAPKEFTVAARLDDTELVHYVAENLVVAGSPGGSIEDGVAPLMSLVSAQRVKGGQVEPGTYDYKMTFVDANGFESLASPAAFIFTVAESDSAVQLTSLPAVPSSGEYVSRRLYRAPSGIDDYVLVGRLDASTVDFTDDAPVSAPGEGFELLPLTGVRGRLDASLTLDPALIVKLRGSRIELGQGTQLLAEGQLQSPVVFTSSLDDRFGAGGTFDTNNDNDLGTPPASPERGDWAGIYAGPTSNVSFDHVQLSYAGGISLLDGGLARGFLPLELQQAEGRVTNSRFEFNDSGQDGAGPAGRFGRLAVTEATIMVRGSQPVIVDNVFVDNRGSIIDIDIESMGGNYRRDAGRQTGSIDRLTVLDDNYGPMIRFNRYLNDISSGLQLSGLEIRAGEITTETTFDDTDIAHLLFDNITVGNLHSSGGLRLLSRPDESLVVKFIGSGSPNAASFGTGITATGSLEGIADRVGGTVHIVGMPGAPVILTSLNDDEVGAGLKPDGSSFTDHDGDGVSTRGVANDWNGIVLDEYSNDNNFAVVPELELLTEAAPGLNGTAANAQFLGELAKDTLTADTVRRLGFEIDGYLSGNHDIDTYSFIGSPGSEVWVDVDRSTFTLDTVVELLDAEGNVLARSDNSADETAATEPTPVTVFSPQLKGGLATSLQASDEVYAERDSYTNLEDFGSDNLRDAGLHFPLGGDRSDPNSRSVYFVRIRSASLNPDDAQGGLTGGQYRMQVRLTEEQAFPGSVVRFANIKYANNGLRIQGLMSDSPLLAEVQENESADNLAFPATNDFLIAGTLAEGPQYIGDLIDNHDLVIGVGGEISAGTDVDLYNFAIGAPGGPGLQSTVFDIDFADGFNRPDTNISIFFDRLDGNPQPELVYFGSASNVLDDLDSPLANDPALESLLRGSIANGDPFIGPVSLPEGNYYVAVSQDGVVPESLEDAVREPINSIRRIAEDRIGADIAAEGYSTANPPAVLQLFDPTVGPTNEFVFATDTDLGHGKPNHFAGVGTPFDPPPANIIHFESDFVSAGFDAPDFVSTDPATTPNDTLGSFQQEDWSLADEDEIGDSVARIFPPFDILGSSNTSTSIPHVSFNGFLQNDAADFFILEVAPNPGNLPSRVILDVDGGWDIADGVPDPLNPPSPFGGSVDTKLVILQPQQDPDLIATESLQLVPVVEPYDPFFPIDLSDDDEVSFSAVEDGRAGSNSIFDPFIETFLLPGTYWVGVLGEDSVLAINDTGATATGSASGTYTLHVSMTPEDPHTVPVVPPIDPPPPGSQVLSYPRDATNVDSTLTSASFDLAGYVAEDLPTLYFNRSYEPAAGDEARLIVTSNENPTGSTLHTFTDGDWEQVRLSLGDFAGHTNIELTIVYDAFGGVSTSEGLRVDDIVIGFAERGETVFDAARGTTFRGFATSNAGAYQLELRRGTEFAERAGVITLQEDFDTNDRQSRSVTLVAPEPGLVSDQDTFVLGDGAVNQRFEFDVAGDGVVFGNTPLNIVGLTTSAEVAGVIRDAINSQSLIEVEASTSGGLDGTETGGGIPTDARVALHGVRTGSFDSIDSVAAAPGILSFNDDGILEIPAILNDGLGDSNHERLQGVVIVEHNVISDVRGVGIWSEPGERDTVPAHAAAAGFGEEAPPVGLSQPGAVINLPEENDSVLGGLAPGILIQNNTLDNAEFAGVKIAGQNQPWVIEVGTGNDILDDGPRLGGADGFTITAAGTTVNFEFEEIGDGDWDPDLSAFEWGAETQGGDGFSAGNVPVYYRHDDDFIPGVYAGRGTEYSSIEMLHSMRESIQGSILMTNALSELVELTVGPSLVNPGAPALYIEGAESVGVSLVGRPGNPDDFLMSYQAPIYEAPQPFAKVVNNTFYGDDGQASQYPEGYEEDGLDGPHQASSLGLLDLEPNDFLAGAVETRVGGSHRAPYTVLTTLGDNAGPADLQSAGDVDFYRVYLNVGDRLIADIDTVAGGPDTVMRLFDEAGIPQAFEDQAGELVTISNNDIAPDYLDPSDPTDYENLLPDPTNERDSFIDYVAEKAGVYYVGVSSVGNENYDTRTLSGRVSGADVGTGTYRITLEALTARSFVMSLANASGQELNGTTFTVTQIEDIPDGFPQISGAGPDNRVTFTFGGIDATNDRIPDVMKLIEGQINSIVGTPFGLQPILPNIDYTTYSDSAVSPLGAILPGSAQALGGVSGANAGLVASPVATDDSTGGFGHIPSGDLGAEIFTAATGSTEQWVFIENVAKIELSPEARAAGLQLTPIDDGDPAQGPFDADRVVEDDVDQLITETGLLITAGASPTALNNVFVNLDDSLVEVASKQQEVIVVGNVFQYAEGPVIGQFPNSTGAGGNDDFNITLGTEEPSLAYPEANDFQPAEGSRLIDSSVNSVVERSAMVQLKTATGLPVSNILAPTHDVGGVLRADNPNYAPPGGIGGSVFKDRGSTELADFNGPVAIAETARDNDAEGIDADPAVSFINLQEGVYRELRIQLRDNGDSSDPFTGIGVDDNTVVVPEIPGLRESGANITLIENDRLLEEGIDYTFNYDSTRNLITLTPIAGIWQNDRSYRIEINNEDRDVLIAPTSSVIQDGDQMEIIDSNGGEIVFEFEAGYSLLLPEPITLVVPDAGTNLGGISDGNFFLINDGVNPVLTFEFNLPGDSKLPGTIPIELPTDPTPVNANDLQVFLEDIADSIGQAIQEQVDNGDLDLDVVVEGVRVVLGAEPGATVSTVATGLDQLPRTLALRVPGLGVNPLGGIVDGDTFEVDNGNGPVIFEFDTGNGVASPLNETVPVTAGATAADVAVAIQTALENSNLGVNPSIEGDGLSVYLDLSLNGSVRVAQGQLGVVGLSRPALDEEQIVILPADGVSDPVVLEINRTDERDSFGDLIGPDGDGVTAPNVPINVTRGTTGNAFAGLVENALQGLTTVDGLNQADIEVIDGGILQIGGEEGLGISVAANSIEVTGSPSVSGASTVEVAGPLLLTLPLIGGAGITDGSVIVIESDTGDDVIFEFNLNGTTQDIATASPVPFNLVDSADDIAATLAFVVNAANIGVTATAEAGGVVSFGRIDVSRVNVNGIFDPTGQTPSAPGVTGAILKRGIVSDGEVLVISQGGITVQYEFESIVAGGGVAPGNVPVPFVAQSTPGDVAEALASTINNNKLGLILNAVAELDPATGDPTGFVVLNDQPGTNVDISAAPTLAKLGVPGGATPIRYSALFGDNEIKLAMIEAINSVNQPGEPAVTTLSAQDRGGNTFFVSNASLFRGVAATGGIVANYSLPGVQDLAGNKLEANRPDLSTQFTLLMPTALLDYGDAPDPLNLVDGRYPTKLVNNGPRHVVGNGPVLGATIDANLDGLPGISANRDDVAIAIEDNSTLFTTALADGGAEITIDVPLGSNPDVWDAETFTLDLGTAQATFEFDVLVSNLGAFDEDNFAVRPDDATSALSIAEAIQVAIAEARSESNQKFNPASVAILPGGDATQAVVRISADDEDGVSFVSDFNPYGVLNRGTYLPIGVSVTGAGVLEGWIDFNADGDWEDPGEQVFPMVIDPATQALRDELLPVTQTGVVSNLFADTGDVSTRVFNIVVPPTTPIPTSELTTYARFRVSKEGGLGPNGLALSGEVEDYEIRIIPGLPPEIANPVIEYDHANLYEDNFFVANGLAGNPVGLLDGITDPDEQQVVIYSEDAVTNEMLQVDPDGPSGPLPAVDAGLLTVNSDGTFNFQPEPDFNGPVTFTARVADQPVDEEDQQLVNSTPLTVTLDVSAVNDAPTAPGFVAPAGPIVEREITEDEDAEFSITDVNDPTQSLIDGKYIPGNSSSVDEMEQPMKILQAGTFDGLVYRSDQNGYVTVSNDGTTITYTPPDNYNSNFVPGTDSFTYIVIDEPGVGFTPQQSPYVGTVNITIIPDNDPPVAVDDSYSGTENSDLVILLGEPGGLTGGIFDNDSAGPSDEPTALSLRIADFPQVTSQGGNVAYDAVTEELTYSPAPDFSGLDTFVYTAIDSAGLESEFPATVTIDVVGVDNPPVFIGVDGNAGENDITRPEAKLGGETVTYNLNTWFSDPDSPTLTYTATTRSIGVFDTSDAKSVTVDGTTAYVADGVDGIRVLDVSDPADISTLGLFDTTDAQSVAVVGTTVYVADGADGLRVLDVSDPASITQLGFFDTSDAKSVMVDGTTAYLADGAGGVRVLDVTVPAAITEAGFFVTTDAQSIIVDGTTAYVADGVDGVRVLDVSNPANISELGSFDTTDAQSVAVIGTTVYVADGADGLRILDVSAPAAISQVGVFDMTDAKSVVLNGTTAYVADGTDGLMVLDVSVPGNVNRIASYPTGGIAQSVMLSADDAQAYVAGGANGLAVVDVTSNPNPSPLFTQSILANMLELDLGEFDNGSALLEVTADDGNSQTTASILVTLQDTPDGPIVITTQDPFPVSGTEDDPVVQDLSVVFVDPDGDLMNYEVVQLGTLLNPTASQIQNHELVQSFSLDSVTGVMTINLQENAFGSVAFTLEADDQVSGTPNAEHDFLLTVAADPDFPTAEDDVYEVPLGSIFQITNVSDGLLGNDSDPDDNDSISFNSVVVQPAFGTVDVNLNGTFIYTNDPQLSDGQSTDQFTYNIRDSTGKLSNEATVTLNLGPSEYINRDPADEEPNPQRAADVTADGFVTALDALRIINFLSTQGSANVPVSLIGPPPPDFLDVNGNGLVSVMDVNAVLTQLSLLGGSGEGEYAVQNPATLGATSSFVAVSRSGLPVREMQLANDVESTSPLDQLLTQGLDLNTAAVESAVRGMEESDGSEAASADSVDQVLASVLDEIDLALMVD